MMLYINIIVEKLKQKWKKKLIIEFCASVSLLFISYDTFLIDIITILWNSSIKYIILYIYVNLLNVNI